MKARELKDKAQVTLNGRRLRIGTELQIRFRGKTKRVGSGDLILNPIQQQYAVAHGRKLTTHTIDVLVVDLWDQIDPDQIVVRFAISGDALIELHVPRTTQSTCTASWVEIL